MLATKYPRFLESPWLTSELASELALNGHSVTILNIEWSSVGNDFTELNDGVLHVRRMPYVLGQGKINLLFKWAFSSLRIAPFILKSIFNKEKYDLTICFSPCTAVWGAIPLVKLISNKTHLIYWDFFPIHNQQISSLIPSYLLPILKFFEKKLVNSFDRVSMMSLGNLRFFDYYFGEISNKQKRDVIPIWTSYLDNSSANISRSEMLPDTEKDNILVVFGGQLTHGRGLESLIDSIKIARKKNPLIKLLVCGSGNLAHLVEDFSLSAPFACSYLGQLSREDYLKVLSVSDIGVVATIEKVDCPTYPSKCLDYMASKLPIIASVESNTDFGEIIENHGFGKSCLAGDLESFNEALLEMSINSVLRKSLGDAGYDYLKNNHSVDNIAKKVSEV
jgi:glycosyltransferase involved in cell wall biosynthesis